MSDVVLVAFIGLASAVIGGTIIQIGEGVRQRRKRKYDKDDGKDKNIEALKTGLKWVIYDRIRYLGLKYISEGAVDFDDRRILKEMHNTYHEGLGGNGDLDNLMNEVNRLPLK